jgi:hypothetical protein
MRRYDVALWRVWPSLFPAWCEVVEAPGPFAAVEAVMRRPGRRMTWWSIAASG